MIRSFAGSVIGEVLLDHSGSEGHRPQHGRVAWGVVGQSEDSVWISAGILREHPKVYEAKIIDGSGVVRVALHDREGNLHGADNRHGSIHVINRRSTGRNDHGFVLRGDVLELFDPIDIARSDLVGIHVRINVVYSLQVVGSRHEFDANIVSMLG